MTDATPAQLVLAWSQLAEAAAELNIATDGMENLRPQRQAVLDALLSLLSTPPAVSDEVLVERMARALALDDGIEICSDASYRHSSYGIRARAVLPIIREHLK